MHWRITLLFFSWLDRNICSCNALNNLFKKVNLSVFDMITELNELKILTKHLLCKCKCQFDGSKYNSNQKWNNKKCWCECKN